MAAEKFPKRNASIRELRSQGMSSTEVSRALNLPLNVVAGVFFRDDHPHLRPSMGRPTDEQLGYVARQAGLSINDLRILAIQRRRA